MAEDQASVGFPANSVLGPHAAHYALLTRYTAILDDMEGVRVANENRTRSLEADNLGGSKEAALLRETVKAMSDAEHRIVLALQKAMRQHPLGPWIKGLTGVGDKQVARLLGTLGDPYWNAAAGRPRRGPAELWAYCGLHTLPVSQRIDVTHSGFADGAKLPAGHRTNDTQGCPASRTRLPVSQRRADAQSRLADGTKFPVSQSRAGAQTPCADGNQTSGSHAQSADDTQIKVGVAARRQRGQRANWNAEAKMRAYLIAESCLKQVGSETRARSVYRDLYDKRKSNTEGRLHIVDCLRCGPSGHPAKAGSPWNDGHRHADALRIVSKELLKDLWRESKRLHSLSAVDHDEVGIQRRAVGSGDLA